MGLMLCWASMPVSRTRYTENLTVKLTPEGFGSLTDITRDLEDKGYGRRVQQAAVDALFRAVRGDEGVSRKIRAILDAQKAGVQTEEGVSFASRGRRAGSRGSIRR